MVPGGTIDIFPGATVLSCGMIQWVRGGLGGALLLSYIKEMKKATWLVVVSIVAVVVIVASSIYHPTWTPMAAPPSSTSLDDEVREEVQETGQNLTTMATAAFVGVAVALVISVAFRRGNF